MSRNSFGTIYKLTSFGESHGKAIGGIIDGCPANIKLNIKVIQDELNRRKPAQSKITSSRNETDTIEFLSGLLNNKTLGTPIAFLIKNNDIKSSDYDFIKEVYRPSHADYTYEKKYGIRDYRGGGRASARETIARVVAGAIAKQIIAKYNISVLGYVSQIGTIAVNKHYLELPIEDAEKNIVRCPDFKVAEKMLKAIEKAGKAGDSLGGIITCIIKNVPVGLGEPVFDKFQAQLAKAMMSINAAKGFDYGAGFNCAAMTGKQHNDSFIYLNKQIKTITNNSGGILGGITNGEDIYFRVAFKPVPSISIPQKTISSKNKTITFQNKGRHDICFVPRAVPIVEAMAAMVTLDFLLLDFCYREKL